MDEDLLVYEQDEVYTVPTSQDDLSICGKLRIIERRHGVVLEWKYADDDTSDSEWAVINTAAVTFTHHNVSDSVEISTPRRNVRPISIELVDLRSYKISDAKTLVLIQRDGTTHPALSFQSGSVFCFVDVLLRYVAVKQSEKDGNLYLILDKRTAAQDQELASMNLVPMRRGPGMGSGGAGQWSSTQQRVWGFLNNMKRDPYTTTMGTLSKFYDTVLYSGEEGYVRESEAEEDVAELFHSLNGFEDLEPGYELLTKKGNLSERPVVDRLSALPQDEFQQYVDDDGRIHDVDPLLMRIFKGGLHPNLRREVWSYLLGHNDWNATHNQREEKRKQREDLYYTMKQQWRTITPDQETRFNGFKERRSLIEKDVNRTDRNHPFYEGEHNSNVTALHDILMTYVMYNFDLGYVQGMSDLLAPILYVTQSEPTAFWCFVGYMDMVYRNFDMDQSGMKQQLKDMHQIVRLVDPELMSYLEVRDSANFYFCFRWLLVRFKRELNYTNTLRLWEVLWTGQPCPNFHLLVAVALLDTEKNTIMENAFGFTEILKHINDISLRIDLEVTLRKAEAIYRQIAASPNVPNSVRTVLGLPPQEEPQPPPPQPQQSQPKSSTPKEECVAERRDSSFTDHELSVGVTEGLGLVGVVTSIIGSAVRHISGEDMADTDLEAVTEHHRESEREGSTVSERDRQRLAHHTLRRREVDQEKRFETALSHQFV